MKTRKKLCLALIICAFGAAYAAMMMRPLPQPLAATYYCQPSYSTCFVPVPTIGSLLP
ncbi:hypothetical protein ID144_03095 [Pseudomonas sp. JM0905a]|uniref:Uncharacterized protein n=1 Tax=Metapseudomonas resinovorans TaxID=53412 RepID=A0ABT4Y399_METRE|nr:MULTISPECIES: hypothetical protein [Pseudomonas]MBD2836027.1 hypothetical protein [Pseudomonas sp. JM0905a]MDA8483137.1 hypothetical protein [Pseudomonas resinovorans]